MTELETRGPEAPRRVPRRDARRRLRLAVVITAAILLLLTACILIIALTGRSAPAEDPQPVAEDPQPVAEEPGETVEETPLLWQKVPLSGIDPEEITWENGRAACPGARLGVDVSAFQQDVDWERAAADGVTFAMLRLGYRGYSAGALFQDERFEQNLIGARDAGLDVGVYFFSQATSEEEAAEEAAFVLRVLDGVPLTLPVVFDWEEITHDEARTDGVDPAELTAYARAFCDAVAEAGYTPGVYFNLHQAYGVYDMDELSDCRFWLAEPALTISYPYEIHLWQFTSAGSVQGIGTAVDLDLLF